MQLRGGRRECFRNLLFRRRSKKIPKLRVTGLCAGNPLVNVGCHQGPLTRIMFQFDDVIMSKMVPLCHIMTATQHKRYHTLANDYTQEADMSLPYKCYSHTVKRPCKTLFFFQNNPQRHTTAQVRPDSASLANSRAWYNFHCHVISMA